MWDHDISGYHVESYKAYKNRAFTKHKDKMKNQLNQILSSSLKGDDKMKLIGELINILQSH